MMVFHDIPQNSDEWFALRLGKATASKFGTFMANDGKAFGDPAKDYALQLALERATGQKADSGYTSPDMERGQALEPVARQLYEEANFCDVLNGGFFCWGEFGDSPDGLIGLDGALEIKCVQPKAHFATLRRKAPDPAYRWQLVGHLDCTGREWVDFVSYCPEFPEETRLLVHRVTASEVAEDIERLRARRADFLALVRETLQFIDTEKAA